MHQWNTVVKLEQLHSAAVSNTRLRGMQTPHYVNAIYILGSSAT